MRLRASDGVYFSGALMAHASRYEMIIDRMSAFREANSA
jgi:hypothetical protein